MGKGKWWEKVKPLVTSGVWDSKFNSDFSLPLFISMFRKITNEIPVLKKWNYLIYTIKT